MTACAAFGFVPPAHSFIVIFLTEPERPRPRRSCRGSVCRCGRAGGVSAHCLSERRVSFPFVSTTVSRLPPCLREAARTHLHFAHMADFRDRARDRVQTTNSHLISEPHISSMSVRLSAVPTSGGETSPRRWLGSFPTTPVRLRLLRRPGAARSSHRRSPLRARGPQALVEGRSGRRALCHPGRRPETPLSQGPLPPRSPWGEAGASQTPISGAAVERPRKVESGIAPRRAGAPLSSALARASACSTLMVRGSGRRKRGGPPGRRG